MSKLKHGYIMKSKKPKSIIRKVNPSSIKLNRRQFLGTLAAAGAGAMLPEMHMQESDPGDSQVGVTNSVMSCNEILPVAPQQIDGIDLSPARWIWFPSARTLPNTFVLFRREFNLEKLPQRASGWITADSRYRLVVNGRYVQRGIAPCDPRYMDVDPLDLGSFLHPGLNVIGVEVFYFATGESMWVAGNPGFLFSLDLDFNGSHESIISDATWKCIVDRGHRPGQYRRWILRGLQEDFDARRHPDGWEIADYKTGPGWIPAMLLDNRADKPSLCSRYEDSLWLRIPNDPEEWWLRKRSIKLLHEELIPAMKLQESAHVYWSRDPLDWFEFRTPDSFRIERKQVATGGPDEWEIPVPGTSEAFIATFEFSEEMVGYPYFTIDAPEGTIIELSCQESHDPAITAWLDTHWFKWMRFTCREGVNRFEASDHDALRWLQLHIRNNNRAVKISGVGIRRRMYPWPNKALIRCSETGMQRLFDACINNLNNSTQETANEPGREREQYGGAGSLQLQGVRYAFGEFKMPQRALRTYSEGITSEGYFLDPWPGHEVLVYLGNREFGMTVYGSSIDEGVTFMLNCWNHFLESGDKESMTEIFPRMLRLSRFLESAILPDGLLPIEKVGGAMLNVWLDDDAFPWNKPARWRQCAFNLHTAAVLKGAMAPMAEAFGQMQESARLKRIAAGLEAATVKRFWSAEQRMFIDNLPWLEEDKVARLSDRALATSILYNQCPGGNINASVTALVNMPKEMAISYPMNSIWRYWALARVGRGDLVINELRKSWTTMPSVIQNNSLPEKWIPRPDSRSEWCYQQVVPLNILYTDIAGIRPLEPGFARCQIRPQLGDLGSLELTAHTARGPIQFAAEPHKTGHSVKIVLPADCECELVLPENVTCPLPMIGKDSFYRLRRYKLKAATENIFLTV